MCVCCEICELVGWRFDVITVEKIAYLTRGAHSSTGEALLR